MEGQAQKEMGASAYRADKLSLLNERIDHYDKAYNKVTAFSSLTLGLVAIAFSTMLVAGIFLMSEIGSIRGQLSSIAEKAENVRARHIIVEDKVANFEQEIVKLRFDLFKGQKLE